MDKNTANILVIDDEPSICEVLQDILEDEGFTVTTAGNGELAHAAFKANVFDVILMDIWMPDIDGISLLQGFQSAGNQSPVIMISGHGTVETAVEAIQLGAYDFLEKPLSTAKLLITLNRALENRAQYQELTQLRNQLDPVSQLIGDSAKLQALRELISRIGKTASWVMVSGAPGSGKGVVARALHQASARSKSPFVEISLAAIPAQNIGRRLFGSEEDGVVQAGCFEQAESGTLYLDEIGDLNNTMQTKLLSALQAGRFLRVGGHQPIEVDVRIICSTNQAIEKMVSDGDFRQDLYYRLNVMQVHVPALIEHLDDIGPLAHYYIQHAVDTEQLPLRHLSSGAINQLRQHNWPGNVRELINVIQRLLVAGGTTQIIAQEIEQILLLDRDNAQKGSTDRAGGYEADYRSARDDFEKNYFEFHLNRLNGNVSTLAKMTGVERTHLYRKLKALDIDPKLWKK